MMQMDDREILPRVDKSKERMEQDAAPALTLLKRTNNLDLVEILGLSEHIKEDADASEHEDDDPAGGD